MWDYIFNGFQEGRREYNEYAKKKNLEKRKIQEALARKARDPQSQSQQEEQQQEEYEDGESSNTSQDLD